MNWLLTTIVYGSIPLLCLLVVVFIALFPVCIVCFCATIVTTLVLGLIVRGCIAIYKPWPRAFGHPLLDSEVPDVIPYRNPWRTK